YVITEQRRPPQHRGIVSDQVIELTGVRAEERCPYPLRRVETVHPETRERLIFLTNYMTLGVSTIAAIYKDR
ncbi:MAG: IS4 family transposase, partial [Sulfuricaulis sp.]